MVPLPGLSASLLVGAVRDQDGYAVADATVRLLLRGTAVARTTTGPDGTFAFDESPDASQLEVTCRYCRPARLDLDTRAERTVVVQRSAALRDRGLGPDDLRALPYGSATQAASLLPFSVQTSTALSDRGFAYGHGTTVVDGLPGYRALDGVDLASALPAHQPSSIDELSPAAANANDERTSGGLFGIGSLNADAQTVRADAGAMPDFVVRGTGSALFSAAATGASGEIARGAFSLPIPLSTGGLTLSGSTARDAITGLSWQGGTIDYRRTLRVATLETSFSELRSIAPDGPEHDTVAAASYQRDGFTAGVRARWTSASGFGIAGTQWDDRAFVQVDRSGPGGSAQLSLAFAQASDAVSGRVATAGGVFPTIALSAPVSSHLTAHANLVDALLEPPFVVAGALPSYALGTTHLLDGSLEYDDGRTFRLTATVFHETIGGSQPATLGGSGLGAVWQVTPTIALRAWELVSRQGVTTTTFAPNPGGNVPSEPYVTSMMSVDNDRNLVWLTIGRGWRTDIIAHGGYLDGDVVAPIGAHLAVVFGTYRTTTAGRVSSIGLTVR